MGLSVPSQELARHLTPPEEVNPRLFDDEPLKVTIDRALEDIRARGDFAYLPAVEVGLLLGAVLSRATWHEVGWIR